MTQKVQTVSEALRRAQEEDEDVFLSSLSREQLEKTGFDVSTFGPFEYVDIYLQWTGDEFQLKYQFDDDPRQTYYFHQHEVGEEEFMKTVEEYLTLGGDKNDN